VKYIFVDEAKSGENTDRPKFQCMMEKANAKEFDLVIAWKLDRFCRSLCDLVNTERTLRKLGIGLCSVTENVDTVSALGRFNFRNLASYSELEREIIGERTQMGLYRLIKEHKWPNAMVPLGFDRRKNGDLRPNNSEVALVNKIIRMYVKIKSLPQTAFILTQEKIVSKKIKIWTSRTVHKIVTNELYVGQFNCAGFHEFVKEFRIVDLKLFRKAQQVRTRYKRGNAKRPPMPRDRKTLKIEKVFNRYSELLEPKKPSPTIMNH
jgi:site-specific DNA recombinase